MTFRNDITIERLIWEGIYLIISTPTPFVLQDRVSRPTCGQDLGVVDPACTMIALHLYTAMIKVIPLTLDSGEELGAFNCKMDDLAAIDMLFLSNCSMPTLVYLTVSDHVPRLTRWVWSFEWGLELKCPLYFVYCPLMSIHPSIHTLRIH